MRGKAQKTGVDSALESAAASAESDGGGSGGFNSSLQCWQLVGIGEVFPPETNVDSFRKEGAENATNLYSSCHYRHAL